jgi:hypothetical protein
MRCSRWVALGAPTALVLLASTLTGPISSAAVPLACGAWAQSNPPTVGADDVLSGLAIGGPGRTWAVGSSDSSQNGEQTMIFGRTGGRWKLEPSPNPAGLGNINYLASATATSPASAWAVGADGPVGALQALIARWNGTAWRQVTSPEPSSAADSLQGVHAISPSDVWAVGSYQSGNAQKTLIVHWNGSRWSQVPSPSPALSENALNGVAATSDKNIWAVGTDSFAGGDNYGRTLIEHWNGSKWTAVPSPNQSFGGNNDVLSSVAAVSASDAWAVGAASEDAGSAPLIEHWNGSRWKLMSLPDLAFSAELGSVAAVSARNVWAVGGAGSSTLIEHWNGSRWQRVISHAPANSSLSAVAAGSASNAWAVGTVEVSAPVFQDNFALHRC